jgi:hypothetical protein
MTPAGRLQNHLKQKVQKSGGQYRKVRWESRRGCPDCYVWWKGGKSAFIEVKAEGDRYSKIQEREVGRMQDAGIPVFTARTIEDIDTIVEKIRSGNDTDV